MRVECLVHRGLLIVRHKPMPQRRIKIFHALFKRCRRDCPYVTAPFRGIPRVSVGETDDELIVTTDVFYK